VSSNSSTARKHKEMVLRACPDVKLFCEGKVTFREPFEQGIK
jgi:hypothetical protein